MGVDIFRPIGQATSQEWRLDNEFGGYHLVANPIFRDDIAGIVLLAILVVIVVISTGVEVQVGVQVDGGLPIGSVIVSGLSLLTLTPLVFI